LEEIVAIDRQLIIDQKVPGHKDMFAPVLLEVAYRGK